MANELLTVKDLHVSLSKDGREVDLIRGVNFSVRPGETLGVVGESGSGKSLTAMSIVGMLPRAARISRGSIVFDGRDLTSMKERELSSLRGEEIGVIFQDPLAYLNPLMTVGDQIGEVLRIHGATRSRAKSVAIQMLDRVGVDNPGERVKDYPHQFSGGMRQRVIIAMALANEPQLVIADEPTTALDVTVQAQVLSMLKELCSEIDAGLILISHDLGIIEETCNSVAVMYGGKIVEHGEVLDVLERPEHPYTAQLLKATPRMVGEVRGPLATIGGFPPPLASPPEGCPFSPRCACVVERCSQQMPPLTELNGQAGHAVACWVATETRLSVTGALPFGKRAVGENTADSPRSAPAPTPGAAAAPGGRNDVVLDVSNARVRYGAGRLLKRDHGREVLKGISLRVLDGEAVGLVGESGSGKSTLARTIVGLTELESGRITVGGVSWTSGLPPAGRDLRRAVQMVFQDSYMSLNPRHTVRQLIQRALSAKMGSRVVDADSEVLRLMETVGLSGGFINSYPYQLSGGQRQRVGLARALALEPRLLVADEPVSALDVSVQAKVINLIMELQAKLGLAVLFIAHDLSVVRHVCDSVTVIHQGEIVESGPSVDVFDQPQDPYTKSLLRSIPGSRAVA